MTKSWHSSVMDASWFPKNPSRVRLDPFILHYGLVKASVLVHSFSMPIKSIFLIADIRIPVKRKKTLRPEKVEAIAEDILENGQTTPIQVREGKTGGWVLIEGYHRLEALRALGENSIEGYEVRARLH